MPKLVEDGLFGLSSTCTGYCMDMDKVWKNIWDGGRYTSLEGTITHMRITDDQVPTDDEAELGETEIKANLWEKNEDTLNQ